MFSSYRFEKSKEGECLTNPAFVEVNEANTLPHPQKDAGVKQKRYHTAPPCIETSCWLHTSV